MKFLNQLDYSQRLYVTRTDMDGEDRERGKATTIRSSGCGLCTAVMVADRLLPNCEFGLEDALALSYEAKANYEVGTNYDVYAPVFAEKLGLRLEMTNDIERLRHCLRTGGAAVINVGPGLFTRGGHYVAAINEEPDGRIAILDPSYREGKFDEDARRDQVEIKKGVIVLCEASALAEDAAVRNPGYFLFWRA